ncbi:MAG: hypothetical protein IK082_05075 [Oscillospiraceae bacterium]|nr:hypothetical protein [Oscillospiraceae bacterium]
MSYASVDDVQARLTYTLSSDQQNVCASQLDDAAVIIDAYAPAADLDAKKLVSIRMVLRLVEANDQSVPVGATQGSQSALGYSQSWTISNGANGELYMTKLEKKLLGMGDKIGARSPVEDMTRRWFDC